MGGEPQKSKFRISSKELTRSFIHIHKSFNRRNLHTQAKQLLAPSGSGLGRNPPLPRTDSLFYGG